MSGFDDLIGDLQSEGPRDPMRVAQQSTKQSFPKRFYKDVSLNEANGSFAIELDGRSVKTPGRKVLALPNLAAAELIVDEWVAQEEVINPTTMPVTRLANTAIDGVADDPQAVKDDVLNFAGTDLLCYRADGPQGLLEMQSESWDPMIDWARDNLGARFVLAEGIMHVAQPTEALSAFGVHLKQIESAFELTALHSMTTLTGSAILSLGVVQNRLSAEEAWKAAHVDEDWQISQWGDDFEAIARREKRWLEMQAAGALLAALSSGK